MNKATKHKDTSSSAGQVEGSSVEFQLIKQAYIANKLNQTNESEEKEKESESEQTQAHEMILSMLESADEQEGTHHVLCWAAYNHHTEVLQTKNKEEISTKLFKAFQRARGV